MFLFLCNLLRNFFLSLLFILVTRKSKIIEKNLFIDVLSHQLKFIYYIYIYIYIYYIYFFIGRRSEIQIIKYKHYDYTLNYGLCCNINGIKSPKIYDD